MESSENSAWENCPHFTTPPLVFPRLSILRATSGGVVEFWRLSQALKKSTLRVNFTAEIPLKFRRGSEKKRVSRGWHLWHWSFHIQSWSLCNKSVESFLIVDILNSASRILQCWSYYVKINSARHCWFSFYILRDYCDVIQLILIMILAAEIFVCQKALASYNSTNPRSASVLKAISSEDSSTIGIFSCVR